MKVCYKEHYSKASLYGWKYRNEAITNLGIRLEEQILLTLYFLWRDSQMMNYWAQEYAHF